MIITTNCGKIQGISMENHVVFKGVPYAKPPVGELRWKDPQPLDPWDGIYQADRFRGRSIQRSHDPDSFYGKEFNDPVADGVPVSEDCLYLNIWTPKNTDGKCPVAFWIHGGAFLGGCGYEKEFDGEAYAQKGVILVTINYRLGVWGFLAHPWLSEESRRGVSGNYGILDQIAALQWVRENIAAFGGDPANITVFGQSAGAMSVQTLISSPLTKGMIARAIIQSGLGLESDHLLSDAEADGVEFTEAAGISNLQELRSLPVEQVSKFAEPLIGKGFQRGGALTYSPVIDGYVMEDGYRSLRQQGKIHHIPYMAGSNADDMLTENLPQGQMGPLYQGVVSFAKTVSAYSPVYAYYFNRKLPGDEAGAFHSAELWYIFGTLQRAWRPWEPEDFTLSETMVSCWTNFMKTGVPASDWQRFTVSDPCIHTFHP